MKRVSSWGQLRFGPHWMYLDPIAGVRRLLWNWNDSMMSESTAVVVNELKHHSDANALATEITSLSCRIPRKCRGCTE